MSPYRKVVNLDKVILPLVSIYQTQVRRDGQGDVFEKDRVAPIGRIARVVSFVFYVCHHCIFRHCHDIGRYRNRSEVSVVNSDLR